MPAPTFSFEVAMVLPLGDDDSGIDITPFVTFALIAANVLVFLYQLTQGNIEGFFQTWSVIPAEYSRGADVAPTHPGPFWITTLSAMFMHGGWLHLGGNMLFLWIFGDNVEHAMGSLRFLVFYLLCGVAATLAHILVGPSSEIPSLGASGAISGVLGAYMVLFPKQRVRVLLFRMITYMPAIAVIGMWIVFQFINGIGAMAQTEETGGVAYAAHVGGFLAGLVLVWVFRRRNPSRA
ncbi:MAG TPA: rhomboid family intramembrane serine protease [Gemmatimonadota bacterium]|nr:rhomboid family intramembrane serine protease [Gemmatimonadota bacterium]